MPRGRINKDSILKAATEIFGKKGFHGASIGEIAKRAGIGKGTVYEYFNSKDDLFVEVVYFNCHRYFSALVERVEKQMSFADKIRIFIDFHQKIIENSMEVANVIGQDRGICLKAETGKKVHQLLKQQRRKVAKLLEEIFVLGQNEGIVRDIDAFFAADTFLDMVFSCCRRIVFLKYSDEQAEEEKKKLVDLLMFGVARINPNCRQK